WNYLGVFFNPNQQTITLRGSGNSTKNSTANSFGDSIARFNSTNKSFGGNYTLNVSFSHIMNNYRTSNIHEQDFRVEITKGYFLPKEARPLLSLRRKLN
ncbi:16142_t:CDS:2, partial [Gigaspora rosea]